jgi:hypothetical protein
MSHIDCAAVHILMLIITYFIYLFICLINYSFLCLILDLSIKLLIHSCSNLYFQSFIYVTSQALRVNNGDVLGFDFLDPPSEQQILEVRTVRTYCANVLYECTNFIYNFKLINFSHHCAD